MVPPGLRDVQDITWLKHNLSYVAKHFDEIEFANMEVCFAKIAFARRI